MKILKLLIKILSFFNCPKMTYNMSSGTLDTHSNIPYSNYT